jgi:hypothetical protein
MRPESRRLGEIATKRASARAVCRLIFPFTGSAAPGESKGYRFTVRNINSDGITAETPSAAAIRATTCHPAIRGLRASFQLRHPRLGGGADSAVWLVQRRKFPLLQQERWLRFI